MTPREALVHWRQITSELLSDIEEAANTTQKALDKKAFMMSSGAFSLSELAASPWKHPYSKRNKGGSVPYSDPAIINKQTGEFRDSWQSGVKTNSMIIIVKLVNNSEVANKLKAGKGRMVIRPIEAALEAYGYQVLRVEINKAIQKFERST